MENHPLNLERVFLNLYELSTMQPSKATNILAEEELDRCGLFLQNSIRTAQFNDFLSELVSCLWKKRDGDQQNIIQLAAGIFIRHYLSKKNLVIFALRVNEADRRIISNKQKKELITELGPVWF